MCSYSGRRLERFRKRALEESLSLLTTDTWEPLKKLLKGVACFQVRNQAVYRYARAGKHGHPSHNVRIGVVYPLLVHRQSNVSPSAT